MAGTNMEQMKKIIEDKKTKGSKQGLTGNESNKINKNATTGFKKTTKTGSLNK